MNIAAETVRVALVILNYRFPEITLRCLESLSACEPKTLFIILVDNSPEEGAEEELRRGLAATGMEYRYVPSPSNGGFTGGMNLGIRTGMAEGFSHMALLNNDTTVAPDFCERLKAEIAVHPDEVLAGRILDDATGMPSYGIGTIAPLTLRVRHALAEGYTGRVDLVSGCFMTVPSAAFRRIGLFHEDYFMYSEDFEFSLRLRKEGIPIRYCPSLVIRHAVSSSTTRLGTPADYYGIRNHAHAVLLHGRGFQKVAYFGYITCLLSYKVRHPAIFMEFVRGLRDALAGRLGKRALPTRRASGAS